MSRHRYIWVPGVSVWAEVRRAVCGMLSPVVYTFQPKGHMAMMSV